MLVVNGQTCLFDDSLSALVHLRLLNLAFRRCELWIQILSYLISIKAACLWFSHKLYITSTLKFWNCRNNSVNVKDCSVILIWRVAFLLCIYTRSHRKDILFKSLEGVVKWGFWYCFYKCSSDDQRNKEFCVGQVESRTHSARTSIRLFS